ncbi:MAG: hypothetical protein ACJ72S_00830 [Nitrososphaeraceae archaeon]
MQHQLRLEHITSFADAIFAFSITFMAWPDTFNRVYLTSRSMGIDPAYDSSAFGIVVTQWVDNHT